MEFLSSNEHIGHDVFFHSKMTHLRYSIILENPDNEECSKNYKRFYEFLFINLSYLFRLIDVSSSIKNINMVYKFLFTPFHETHYMMKTISLNYEHILEISESDRNKQIYNSDRNKQIYNIIKRLVQLCFYESPFNLMDDDMNADVHHEFLYENFETIRNMFYNIKDITDILKIQKYLSILQSVVAEQKNENASNTFNSSNLNDKKLLQSLKELKLLLDSLETIFFSDEKINLFNTYIGHYIRKCDEKLKIHNEITSKQ